MVVVFVKQFRNGESVVAWREAGYHEMPEYENIKNLLKMPREDAEVSTTS